MGGLGSEVGMVVGEVLGHEHGHRPSVPVLANERELLFHLANVGESIDDVVME